jgi:hypothetical protein
VATRTGHATLQRGNTAGLEPGEPSGEPSINWSDRFGAVPFEDKSGSGNRATTRTSPFNACWMPWRRKDRILLTLATGTGKTAIAFQIAWKLVRGALEPET